MGGTGLVVVIGWKHQRIRWISLLKVGVYRWGLGSQELPCHLGQPDLADSLYFYVTFASRRPLSQHSVLCPLWPTHVAQYHLLKLVSTRLCLKDTDEFSIRRGRNIKHKSTFDKVKCVAERGIGDKSFTMHMTRDRPAR